MPQSPGNQSDLPSADFGANEWLVEEMYDQYQRDPGSVDATWVKYFQTNGHAAGSGERYVAARDRSAEPAPPSRPRARSRPQQVEHKDPTPTPAPVAKPRPETKAAEPAKGTTNPMPKESRPAAPAAGRATSRRTPCSAAPRPAPRRTWTPR